MGRKHRPKSRPQSSKDRLAAAIAAIEAMPPRETLRTSSDKLPRNPRAGAYGRKVARPPGVARVAPYVDEARTKASAAHDGFHGAGKDPNPPRTTIVRSRKGGISAATVKPHAPVDACPVCWHEEAVLARIGDRPMDPVTPLRACREHYAPRPRAVATEVDVRPPIRPGRVRIDVPVDKRYQDEIPASLPVSGPVPPPSRLDGATTEQIDTWSQEHGEAWAAAADWRSRYAQ